MPRRLDQDRPGSVDPEPPPRRRRDRSAPRAAGIALALLWSGAGDAAELLVVDQDGCPYCERFEAEIGAVWPNTEEGRRAPLRRIDLHGPWPGDLADIPRPAVTPTFVLLDDGGGEVDRLVGYPGDEHFWFLAGEMLSKLDTP